MANTKSIESVEERKKIKRAAPQKSRAQTEADGAARFREADAS